MLRTGRVVGGKIVGDLSTQISSVLTSKVVASRRHSSLGGDLLRVRERVLSVPRVSFCSGSMSIRLLGKLYGKLVTSQGLARRRVECLG